MSSAGHAFDAIRRTEANRALLRARRERSRQLRAHYLGSAETRPTGEEAVPDGRTAEAIREIRLRTRQRRRRERIAGWVTGIVLTIAAILLTTTYFRP